VSRLTHPERFSILITVSGQDVPGITSELTGAIASHGGVGLRILDISQAVIQGMLTLSLLFESPETREEALDLLRDLSFKSHRLGLKLESEMKRLPPPGEDGAAHSHQPPKLFQYAVTLIATEISARALHEVTSALAQSRVNIDMIKRLSEGEFGCVEMGVSSSEEIDLKAMKKHLLEIAKNSGVDIALQAEGLYRRSKRLVVMDMDSTLIQAEVIDELARDYGVYEKVAGITHRAMMGEMDFDESLKLRCQFLKGLPLERLEVVYRKIELTQGAPELIQVLKKLGYKIALISGGFTFVADRLKDRLGIDFAYANLLEVDAKTNTLAGTVRPPVVNAQRKADLLDVIAQQEKIDLDQVIAIGDGANDVPMLEKAGLGIAFNAKPSVRERADLALSQKNMQSILFLLGVSEHDVKKILAR
jgi:phosphoserine phosphatase